MSVEVRGDIPYVLTHTPREIAEEKGVEFVGQLYQIYYWRFRDCIEFPEFHSKDYYDKIPDDDFFQKASEGTRFTSDDLKIAFISICASDYADEHFPDEAWY